MNNASTTPIDVETSETGFSRIEEDEYMEEALDQDDERELDDYLLCVKLEATFPNSEDTIRQAWKCVFPFNCYRENGPEIDFPGFGGLIEVLGIDTINDRFTLKVCVADVSQECEVSLEKEARVALEANLDKGETAKVGVTLSLEKHRFIGEKMLGTLRFSVRQYKQSRFVSREVGEPEIKELRGIDSDKFEMIHLEKAGWNLIPMAINEAEDLAIFMINFDNDETAEEKFYYMAVSAKNKESLFEIDRLDNGTPVRLVVTIAYEI